MVEGVQDYRPYLRMAQSLASLDLAEDALLFLMRALEEGLEPAPELLSCVFALGLGPLERDPWDVLRSLRGFDLPTEIILAPTSEETPPEIHGTDDDELYRTHRWFFADVNTTWYQVPLPNGRYTLRLHFAEIDPDYQEPGSRVFDVRAEGELLLEDYETLAAAGFLTADVHSFEVEVRDGYLDLHLYGNSAWSYLSALEIIP